MDTQDGWRKWAVLLGFDLVMLAAGVGCDEEPNAFNPVVELVLCPPDTVTPADTCRFEWSGSDHDGRVVGYYYRVNDDSPWSHTTAVACTLRGLPLGRNVFFVQAEDDDSRRSQVASCAFTIVEEELTCEVSVEDLDFGTVAIGDASERNFTITNVGEGVLSGEVHDLSAAYYIVSDKEYSLSPGESHEVTVAFSPTSCGAIAGVIFPGNNACSDVSCTGEGAEGGSEISPPALDFGMPNPGSETTRQVFITNYGCTTLCGKISEQSDCYRITCGEGDFALPTLQILSVLVRFNPPACGTYTCSISTGNALVGDIPCTGRGVGGGCQLSPAMLNFGIVLPGQSSELSFTIINRRCEKVVGTIGGICPQYYIVYGGGMFSLSPGGSQLVTVRFSPTKSGTYNCTIDTGTILCGDVECFGEGGDAARD